MLIFFLSLQENGQPESTENAEGNAESSVEGKTEGNAESNAESNAEGKTEGNAEGKTEANAEAEGPRQEMTESDDTSMCYNQQVYSKGDFVYVEPRERGMELSIIHIERLWVNQEGKQMLYGNFYFRPNETYHVTTRRFLEKVTSCCLCLTFSAWVLPFDLESAWF